MSKLTNYKRIAFLIVCGTLLSKVSGFFREILIGAKFGTSSELDAYLVAMTVPSILVASLGAAISTTFIPVYSDISANKSGNEANKFTTNSLNVISIVALGISIITIVFAKFIVPIIAPGFSGDILSLSIRITRWVAIVPLLLSISSILVAYLQANNEFILPAVSGFIENAVIIAALLFARGKSIFILAIAGVIGLLFRIVPFIPAAKNKGYKYSFYVNFKNPDILQMMKLTLPVLVGVSTQQISVLVDRMLASGLPTGSIAALNYANKLNLFVFGVFSTSIATAVYPTFSKQYLSSKIDEFKNTIESSVGTIFFVVAPISIAAMVLCKPIIELTFKRGAFDEYAVSMTAVALMFYSIGMLGFALRDVLSRAFYSMQDTKTPMYNSIITVVLNVILNIILVKYLKHGGLALATSISGIVCTIILYFNLNKKLAGLNNRRVLADMLKITAVSALMGAIVYILNLYFDRTILLEHSLVKLVILAVIGTAVYGAACLLINIREMHEFVHYIRNRFFKGV